MDHLCYFCLVLLCFRARLFIDALCPPVWKGLTCWLSFVISNCEVVTFPLVYWVRCGALWIPDICPCSYYEFSTNSLLLAKTKEQTTKHKDPRSFVLKEKLDAEVCLGLNEGSELT